MSSLESYCADFQTGTQAGTILCQSFQLPCIRFESYFLVYKLKFQGLDSVKNYRPDPGTETRTSTLPDYCDGHYTKYVFNFIHLSFSSTYLRSGKLINDECNTNNCGEV